MNLFKKAFCRTFQAVMHAAIPLLPYREPKMLGNIVDIEREKHKKRSPYRRKKSARSWLDGTFGDGNAREWHRILQL